MSTRFQAVIFLLGIVGLSGVALAQQLRGWRTQGPVPAAILKGAELGRVRVPGPVRLRYAATDCGAGFCTEPPRQVGQSEVVAAADACSSLGPARDRNGRPVRRLCTFN
ncbi:hypothetical protein [Bosea sp. AS-1]|uniref:hypothetical protein n=1 Tax=Bosea sp. AS-1 TaxID=2015316 RepID=UPI0012FDC06E|nr:hypothetical protein [Bosea sp. AS-1]